MTWDFRFSCTGCGKCCTSSPSIFMNEVEEQADKMLFRPSLRIGEIIKPNFDFTRSMKAMGFSSDKRSSEETLKAHNLRILNYGATIKGKRSGMKLKAYWSITDLTAGHINQCTFRKSDMSCGIYDERPIICRAVPFIDMPRGPALKKSLEDFVKTEGFECNTSSSADLLVENGKLLESGYRSGRTGILSGRPNEDISWVPIATEESLNYVEAYVGTSQLTLSRLYAEGKIGTGFAIPFGVLVMGMVESNVISPSRGVEILNLQIGACESAKARISEIGLLNRKPPKEASSHGGHEYTSSWGDYIDGHKMMCDGFVSILNGSSDKKERMKAVESLSLEVSPKDPMSILSDWIFRS